MKYYCNPININYRYQFNADQRKKKLCICREAADPSMILFRGKYYIFASMTLGFWVSEDLVNWENKRLPDTLPLYDYAPDVRVMGDYVYFCASKRGEICDRFRTKDIENGPYEKIPGTFDYWDPNLFVDDDGRVYFYWGCSNMTPVYGVELNPESMEPIGEKVECIWGHPEKNGYERIGDDNAKLPKTEEEIEAAFQAFMKSQGTLIDQIPSYYIPAIRGMFSDKPYIEGAWMDKYEGKYYLQYAFSGTQYNIYGDGVYVGESPLGPFKPAKNNPYSYVPGGFITGAGHGSTMRDKNGNLWHTATMRISINHDFERRVGLWPAGFDREGNLFCNQRFADWPIAVEENGQMDPWKKPEWMLLSYKKKTRASSAMEGHSSENIANENIRTFWQPLTNDKTEWVEMDLGQTYDVRAIQVNFGDSEMNIPVPGTIRGTTQARYIEEADTVTRYFLEGSLDGENYFVIEDKSDADTDLSHDFLVREEGLPLRYLRLRNMEVPYGQNPCVSGLRVFGIAAAEKPEQAEYTVTRISPIDMEIKIRPVKNATGYNILWGFEKDKLYHSRLTYNTNQRIGALIAGDSLYVRVDTFNEGGITEGSVTYLQ